MTISSQTLKLRSDVLQAIRSYFIDHEFIEVETPVRIPVPALEQHIDAEPSGNLFLRTSPELHMKRMLADGHERIFQIGPCFRQDERGKLHNPEYTMLEWYRTGADYLDMIADTKAMISSILKKTIGKTALTYRGTRIELMPVWDCVTVREAFLVNAGWDPVANFDANRFDVDMVSRVEPALPAERPVILKDYPVEAAALARCTDDDPPVAERWELYIGGLELANAFSELTNPAEQRRRFEECARIRETAGKQVYPLDEAFLAVLEQGMPPSGGVALGIDRLVMLIADAESIDEVRTFCI